YGRFFACVTAQRQIKVLALGASRPPLQQLAQFLIGGMVRSYRLHRGILRALMLYARTHRDPEFRRQADAMNAIGLDLAEQLVLRYAEQIGHPDPRAAVRWGLFLVGYVLRETVLGGEGEPRLPFEEERLEEELTRMYLGYLGVAVPHEGLPPPDWA